MNSLRLMALFYASINPAVVRVSNASRHLDLVSGMLRILIGRITHDRSFDQLSRTQTTQPHCRFTLAAVQGSRQPAQAGSRGRRRGSDALLVRRADHARFV